MRLERTLSILDHAYGRLRRRPLRSLLVLSAFALTVFLLSTVLMTSAAMEEEASASLESAPDVTVQKLKGGRQVYMEINRSELESIRSMPGIESVEARVWGHYFDAARGSLLTVYGVEPGEGFPEAVLAEGHGLEGGGEAVIGRGLSARDSFPHRSGKSVGESLWLLKPNTKGSVELDVVGTFSTDSAVVTNDLVVTSKEDTRRLFEMEDSTYTDLAVRLHNPNEVGAVADKLSFAFPGSRVLTKSQLRSTYSSAFGWRSGLFLAALVGSLASFLLLAWDQAGAAAGRDRREVAVLKACGWSTSDVLRMKVAEGAVLSLTGFLVGATASYLYVAGLGAPGFTAMLSGWSSIYPSFSVAAHVSPEPLLPVFAVSVIPFMAATLVPAWRAAATDPEEVMRGG